MRGIQEILDTVKIYNFQLSKLLVIFEISIFYNFKTFGTTDLTQI